MGSKVWPKRAVPYVQAAGNFITASFCLILAGLAIVSLRDHFRDYAETDGAGGEQRTAIHVGRGHDRDTPGVEGFCPILAQT